MTKIIEAVLFDFDHTLGVDHRLEQGVLRDLSARYCERSFDDGQIDVTLERFRSGAVSLTTMLAEAFASCGAGADLLSVYKAEALARVPKRITAFPDCSAMLDALLLRGIAVAVLTNGWAELQHAKAAAIGFRGPVFVSEEIGAWKPDPRAFEIAAASLGSEPQRIAYVGDSPTSDVAGSKAVGMTAIWADLEDLPYPAGAMSPDYTIRRLGDIADLPVFQTP